MLELERLRVAVAQVDALAGLEAQLQRDVVVVVIVVVVIVVVVGEDWKALVDFLILLLKR